MENRAVSFFKDLGLEDRLKIMDESTASAIEAAQTLGVELGTIAKSLTFRTADRPVLIVMSGDAKIHSKSFKEQFKVKSKMLDSEDVVNFTGYEVGGVCPFNLATNKIDVYLDKSLQRYEMVYPGAGTTTSLVEVSISELEEFTNFIGWIDIGKDWE